MTEPDDHPILEDLHRRASQPRTASRTAQTEIHEEPTVTEPPYRPPTAPLEYARTDRVSVRSSLNDHWYIGTVHAAFVTGENTIVPTYVVTLDGCDGAITVTEDELLRKEGETDG